MVLPSSSPITSHTPPRAVDLVLAHQLVGLALVLAELAGHALTEPEALRATYKHSLILLCAAGTVLGIAVATLVVLRRMSRIPAAPSYAALIAVAAYAFGTSLFSGSWISRQWFAPYGPPLLGCGALFAGWVGVRLTERSRARRGWSWPATLAVLGTALAIADAKVLPDLYPTLHAWTLLGAWLLLAQGLVTSPLRLRGWSQLRRFSWLPVVLIAASVPLSWRKGPNVSHRLHWKRSPGCASRVYESRFALWRAGAQDSPAELAPAIEAWLRSEPGMGSVRLSAASAAWNTVAPPPSRPAAETLRRIEPRPHIVLITVDTLRADVASEGASWSALAARGLSFERAYSPAASTDKSLRSLVSGRNDTRYDRGSIVRALRHEGYDTTLVTAQAVIDFLRDHDRRRILRFAGSGQHLPLYWLSDVRNLVSVEASGGGATSTRITEAASQALRRRQSDVPTFTWVHFFDLHEWPDLTASAGTERERYESIWAEVDAAIGGVVRAAEAALRDRPVVFVLTSDHGEYLDEAGRFRHGRWVDSSLTHVPLVVIVPGHRPQVVTRPVGVVDVAATLAELAALNDFECDAISLLREDVDPRRPLIMGDSRAIAIVRGHHRVILAPYLEGLTAFDDSVITKPRPFDPRTIPNFEAEFFHPLLGSPMGVAVSSPLADP